ncbi:hypothetical protein D0C37_17480 [Streptomyces koyangensis]|uniref:Uncharacterized protein n=1 Tax=Streptomyces koyangensis TaxID=188770 RepID=A0A385DEU5_9ACTN|nr:hypothetical protein D0C37_17480 [Streptomyces koyangensis]
MGWGDGPWARYTRDVRLFGVRALPVADLVLVPVPAPLPVGFPFPFFVLVLVPVSGAVCRRG